MSEEKKTVPAYPFMSSFQRKIYPPASQCPSIFPPPPHHDGKLDDRYDAYLTNEGVGISDSCDDHVDLSPKTALSLLAWLRQQENELQQMAKDENT
jgi:hypothetical protein